MITVADVFNNDLFSTTSLVSAINEIPYVPSRLAELGIFAVDGIPTTELWVEKLADTLVLVPNTQRGAAGTDLALDRRTAIPFQCSHLQIDDTIKADDLQNVRDFGAMGLQTLQSIRDRKLRRASMSIDLTLEYQRLGAIQGLVMDADGTTVLTDLFDRFGISAPADVGLALDASWTEADGGRIKALITPALRDVDAELGGLMASGYWAACGPDFFDALIANPELRETYKFQAEASALRDDGRRTVKYAGVTWEDYRGVGNVKIADDEARLVPLGVPKLFQQVFGPTDTLDYVNTPGQVKYTIPGLDPSGKNKFLSLETQSNPATICTRPKVLRKFTLGA